MIKMIHSNETPHFRGTGRFRDDKLFHMPFKLKVFMSKTTTQSRFVNRPWGLFVTGTHNCVERLPGGFCEKKGDRFYVKNTNSIPSREGEFRNLTYAC